MSSAFDDCAQEYDQYRPEYPDALFHDLIAAFCLTPASLVVDAGTGTGRAALALAALGPRVLGLDPSPAMLDQARRTAAARRLSNLDFRLGTAESTGLPDSSAEAVIMAQAFHWVDSSIALAELQRVLKPGGGLALFWNRRDLTLPYLMEMETLIARYNPQYSCHYREKPWGDIITGSGRFQQTTYKPYRHTSQVPVEAVVGLTRSLSYVRNALAAEATAAFEHDLRALLAPHARAGLINLTYCTDLWLARSSH